MIESQKHKLLALFLCTTQQKMQFLIPWEIVLFSYNIKILSKAKLFSSFFGTNNQCPVHTMPEKFQHDFSLFLFEYATNVFPPHYNRIKNSAIMATGYTILLPVRFVKSHDNLLRLNIHIYVEYLAQPVSFRPVSLPVECGSVQVCFMFTTHKMSSQPQLTESGLAVDERTTWE